MYQSKPNKWRGVVNAYNKIGHQNVIVVSAVFLSYPLLAAISAPLDGIINAHNTVQISLKLIKIYLPPQTIYDCIGTLAGGLVPKS